MHTYSSTVSLKAISSKQAWMMVGLRHGHKSHLALQKSRILAAMIIFSQRSGTRS